MPSDFANSSSCVNYWYDNALPNGLAGSLPADEANTREMRQASEAVIESYGEQSQDSSGWEHSPDPLHVDPSANSTLPLRPQSSSSAVQVHKAPLAPKQGLVGILGSSKPQYQSPISGTYALRTPRGKITSIACESCRKRKSKCDGLRPKCNTCRSKNLCCVYDVAEDGKTTTQLRAHVRRLARELDDMKSVVSMLTMAPDRSAAASWANELEKNGFAYHSAEEIKRSLQKSHSPQNQMPGQEQGGLDTPGSEPCQQPSNSEGASSYNGSSGEESRERTQPASNSQPEPALETTPPFNYQNLVVSSDLDKFSFDCAFYRRTKREMVANGWDEAQIFGQSEIDVDSIILGFTDPQDGQPVPTWASRTVNKLLPGLPLPARLASTFLLTKMMRWLIWPSVENMNAMPEWLMPLSRQDCSPYDILIDLIPWPQLRQHLYRHPGDFVVGAFVGCIGLNWPYADDACHYWDIERMTTQMTPLFESQVCDLNSWTLDPKALEIMPQIQGLVPIKIMFCRMYEPVGPGQRLLSDAPHSPIVQSP
ncbi:hypothetical protein BCR34DRAFT_677358 [Clohesyomyces aquaticus]|uniref:Zn(2)-C6 fungal-type domain-containing protein n=1 Tax=Clohesyomyces aquaticus TaxID=1231657 RepID=A0A1Y1YEJ2_9PLEO|nr:hypothetical protein BCR34DRAFT_677358 [Clohesyomyces aquaticus]